VVPVAVGPGAAGPIGRRQVRHRKRVRARARVVGELLGADRWKFLLGEDRVQALCDLSERLAPVCSQYTAPAVVASVSAWGKVGKCPGNYVDPIGALKRLVYV